MIVDLENFLWTEADAYNSTFDNMISDYIPDCALINCVLPELSVTTREPLDSILFAPKDPFVFSQMFYCNSSLFTNKVTQNITTQFSNNLIASAYSGYFDNAISNYPFTGLIGDLTAGDSFTKFYDCYPKEITRALLDMLTTAFINELGSQITLNDVIIDFLLTPPIGADEGTYILEHVDRDQFIDYLLLNYPTELETVVSNLDGNYDEVLGNKILLNALTECQFKSCLKDNWDDIVGSDTSVIFEFVRYNDWVNVANGVFTNYPDSFTHAFAYLYSSKVATVLEGHVVSVVEPWHYSLYAFMDGVESFYGSAMKDKIDGDTLVLTQYVRMKEFHLYGSSRLGILNQNDTLKRADLHYKLSLSDPSQEPELFVETEDLNQYAPDSIYTLKQGNRLYEGSNHLGNVLVTFSDKRIGYCTNDSIYYYRADVRTANDYAAFGAPLDDRQWYSTADSGVYRFGFNGQEKDNERSGLGNGYTTEFRQYDSRLGRWFSLDPAMTRFPWQSPYNSMDGNPIYYKDPFGDWVKGAGLFRNLFNSDANIEARDFANTVDGGARKSGDGWLVGYTDENNVSTIRYFGSQQTNQVRKSSGNWEYYADPLVWTNTDNGSSAHGYVFGANTKGNAGQLSGEIRGFGAHLKVQNDGVYGIDLGVAGLEGEASGHLGNNNFNLGSTAKGAVLQAGANAHIGIKDGQAGAAIGAGAYAAKGEVNPGITLWGWSIGVTLGGSVGSAHIGGEVSAGRKGVAAEFHLGLGAGFKLGFNFTRK